MPLCKTWSPDGSKAMIRKTEVAGLKFYQGSKYGVVGATAATTLKVDGQLSDDTLSVLSCHEALGH